LVDESFDASWVEAHRPHDAGGLPVGKGHTAANYTTISKRCIARRAVFHLAGDP
jgi:hypothetical protein